MNSTRLTPIGEYAELRRLVIEAGLLEKQPAYYARQIFLVLGCYTLAVVVLMSRPSGWMQLLDAVLLAFVFAQVAFLGHDASHHQIFTRRTNARIFCLACNLLIGVSYSWWADKHTRHHRAPNQIGVDPDVGLRLLAFSAEQARTATGLSRAVIRHQAFAFLALLAFEGIALRAGSVKYLLRGGARFRVVESVLIAVHGIGYVALVLAALPVWQGALFVAVHQALFGIYMGAVFAPNHKGMPLIANGSTLDPLQRHILTSRNVQSHPITDFMFGGLNYQIEHHLFPKIPRNRLKETQRVVRAFCSARGHPYHEAGLLESYREALSHLHHVGASLRESPSRAPTDLPRDRVIERHSPNGLLRRFQWALSSQTGRARGKSSCSVPGSLVLPPRSPCGAEDAKSS